MVLERAARSRSSMLCAASLWVLSLSLAAQQSLKLNDDLFQALSGDVWSYDVSADGAYIVYVADQTTDEVRELFLVPADASAPPVRRNAPLTDGDVSAAQIGAGRIVYTADQDTDGVMELYNVPLFGGPDPIRLNGDLAPGGSVHGLMLSADGTQVFYRADQLGSTSSLFRVPIDGSAAPTPLAPGLEVENVWLTPDGDTAVFNVTGDSFITQRLYSVPTDGSAAPIELDQSNTQTGWGYSWFDDVQFAQDGEHIVYEDATKDDETDPSVYWATRIDGTSAPVALTDPLPPPGIYLGDVGFNGNEHVVFSTFGGFSAQLYAIRIDGTGLVQLNPDGSTADDFGLAPNGSFVLFEAAGTLYGGPVDGTPAAIPIAAPGPVHGIEIVSSSMAVFRTGGGSYAAISSLSLVPPYDLTWLNPSMRAGEDIHALRVDPAGQHVVYNADETQEEVFELYEVPTDGSALPRALNTTLPTGGDVSNTFTITSDGARVVYLADQTADNTFELFGALLDSVEPPVRYNLPLPATDVLGDVQAFRLAPDGTTVVYLADVVGDDFFDLYSVPANDAGPVRRLTETLSPAGDVQAGFAFSGDGEHVVFDYLNGATHRLYATPTSPSSLPVQLDTSQAAIQFRISGTGTEGGRVVYLKSASGALGLYSAPIDGGEAPIALSDPPGTQTVPEFDLTPDGSTAVYRAEQDSFGVFELYRVPFDGSGPALKLSPPMVTGGDVQGLAIGPEGTRVAYRADQDTDNVFELYSVPIDGSTAAVRLSGAMVLGGDMSEFAFTPDAQHLLYRADETVNSRFELYGAPADGSSASVRLTVLAAGNVDPDFQGSPDGLTAFYRANPAVQHELFAVPVDGSAAPATLSGTLAAGGNVTSFAIAPDGSHVVYVADARVDGIDELFSVLPTGGTPTALVTLPPLTDVTAYRIDPASGTVFYVANPAGPGIVELFRVPIDGSEPPERVSRPLPTGGGVMDDFVPLSDGQVIYRADQSTNDIVELYRSIEVDLDEPLLPHAAPTRTRSIIR